MPGKSFSEEVRAIVAGPQPSLTVKLCSEARLYRGVLAARSRFRARVVALAQSPSRDSVPEEELRLCRPDRRSKLARRRWLPWARLLHRVFEVDGWACPGCRQRMVLRSVTIDPPATMKLLRGLSTRAPPARVARGV